MYSRLAAGAALLLTITPCVGSAQVQEDGGTQDIVLEELKDGDSVRLASAVLGQREGKLLGHGPTELVLSAEPQLLRVPLTAVDTLWTRGSSMKQKAIIGVVAGAAVGTFVGAFITGSSSDQNLTAGDGVLIGAPIGAALGGVLGLFIGSFTPKWHRRYP